MIHLPTVNAALNGVSAVFLALGFYFIRRKKVIAHRVCMGSAMATSFLFLLSYLYYHAHHGTTSFLGQGWIRPVYFTFLVSHTVLAAFVPFLALVTITRALKGRFNRHVWWARLTWPIWMYVSFSGVVIYFLLY